MEFCQTKSYRIYFEVPWLARLVQINYDFLIRQPELFQSYVSSMCIWTAMIGVESDLRRGAVLHIGGFGNRRICPHACEDSIASGGNL